MTPKQLRELGEHLFSNRGSYMTLLQEIAEQFYVERADFTVIRTLGDDYASHLSSSYPLLVRRDFGNAIGQMLRPKQKPWFHTIARDVRVRDNTSRRWLERADGTMRLAMYDPEARLTRAATEADHDYGAFGQCVLSIELNRFRESLLYRNWHIRDVAWREDQDGKVDFVSRKWKVAVADVLRYFPKAELDPKIRIRANKTPFDQMTVMHIVCAAELWDGNARGRPRVSMFYDLDHDKPIEQTPIWARHYIIPRWQTISGSQYAFSPAAVCALPEGRLLQAMTLTILEAGEKAVNPPLVATRDAVKSDMQQFPGGVTWVDAEYDERLGQALRAMNIDVKGLPISLEMLKDSREVLMRSFFLDKLRAFNPTSDPEMTAFQAGQIVQEYIRQALPLFEPMEAEYNAALCDETFDLLYRNGAFGSPQDIPQELRNADVEFRFESPLHDAIEQQKGMKFLEFKQLIATAIALDPTVSHIPDIRVAFREAADGIRVPANWMRNESQVDESILQAAQVREQQQLLQT
ncbi:MAG: portal protein, partial [Burkholderiales bacterium]